MISRHVKHWAAAWVLGTGLSAAAAGSLESQRVTSVDDVAACYAIQPYLVEEPHEGGVKTTHWVGELQIQNGCTDKAVAFAKTRVADTQLLKALASEVRRGHRLEAALKVFKVMVEGDGTKASCIGEEIDAAIKAGLAQPTDYPSRADSDVKNALDVVGVCLANKQFREDMKEELTYKKASVNEHLCPFLKERKVVSICEP